MITSDSELFISYSVSRVFGLMMTSPAKHF